MIISHEYKIVFICIHKNASQFVTKIILNIDPNAIKDCTGTGLFKDGHQTFKFIKTMDIYSIIKDYTFFVIIRNPIDQLISWWNYTRNNCEFQSPSIQEFIKNNEWVPDQLEYITDINGDINYNIKFINFNKLQIQLTQLFISLGINTELINKYNYMYDKKINDSIQYYTKNKNTKNDLKLLLYNKKFAENLFFYNILF
jgi:hypothetical protein